MQNISRLRFLYEINQNYPAHLIIRLFRIILYYFISVSLQHVQAMHLRHRLHVLVALKPGSTYYRWHFINCFVSLRSRWKRPVNTSLFYFLQGILLYCEYQASTFDESKLPSHRFEAMDHFAKCFLILRLEDSQVEGGLQTAEEDRRGWRAVRVDLVSPPVDRYAFALLGWSGSRVRRIIENEWKLGSCRKKVWVERNVLVVIQYILEVLKPQFGI